MNIIFIKTKDFMYFIITISTNTVDQLILLNNDKLFTGALFVISMLIYRMFTIIILFLIKSLFIKFLSAEKAFIKKAFH